MRDVQFEGVDAGTLAALRELVLMKWQLQALEAQREQDALAAAMPEMAAAEGIGPMTRIIQDSAFHDWAIKTGSYDCWKDKGFNKYIDRIAPESKPVCRGVKPGNGFALQVGWRAPRPPRFVKKYADEEAQPLRIADCGLRNTETAPPPQSAIRNPKSAIE